MSHGNNSKSDILNEKLVVFKNTWLHNVQMTKYK